MTHYLISFPSSAIGQTFGQLKDEDWAALDRSSHEIIREAKAAGVYVFSGGIDEGVAPVRVAADGTVDRAIYAESGQLNGGFCILDLPTREAAEEWAAKMAAACWCDQELRQFHPDPES